MACALAVTAGGCLARTTAVTAPGATPGKYGAGVRFASSAPRAPKPTARTRTIVIPARDRQPGPNAGAGPVHIDTTPQTINDDGEVGANAHLYLNQKVPKLVVEVDAVKGWEPSHTALSILRDRLTRVASKPGGVVILPTQVIPRLEGGEAPYEKTEQRYRSRHSTADAMALYVLYADGDTDGVIGAAYSSSAIVIFKQAIVEAASTPLVTAESIENSVIVHEAGHVLALVNIGYKSPRDHEDPGHEHHSNNPDSVMYWAVDSVGVASLIGGRRAPPTDFDAADLADLRDLRDGRLP